MIDPGEAFVGFIDTAQDVLGSFQTLMLRLLEYGDKQLIIRTRLILTSSMSLQGLQIQTYFVPRISNPWL